MEEAESGDFRIGLSTIRAEVSEVIKKLSGSRVLGLEEICHDFIKALDDAGLYG